ncbi:MAG: entericidin A/B family lipoprotein [Nitrospirae bacterium]|nr:entericidin A/B family lipoprotein [Nitrospirota bacterium]
MKNAALIALVVLCFSVLAGCNTVGGLGKDISSGGQAIEKASGTKKTE